MFKLYLMVILKLTLMEIVFTSAKKCGVNEIYDICLPICPPQRCDVDEKVIFCPRNPEPGEKACKQGCRCIDNYKKNKSNVCIPKEECPGVVRCGPNEIISSCVNGGCGRWNCSQTGDVCIKLPEGACREGCHCKDSYLRADNGTCIPADQCPPPIPPVTCRSDEVYNGCANGGCGRWECWQQGPICIDLIKGGCKPGCRCVEPLLRANDGSCVPADQCPLTCYGQNEEVGCRTLCPETCESIGKNCTIIEPTVCIPECHCKQGFYRNKNGVCVSEKQCSPIPPIICRPDEVYNECANGGCGRWECSQQGQVCVDLAEGDCVPGCRCAEPLLRAGDGTCVPPFQCPRNCTGPHEFFSCGSACDNVCATLSTQNQTNCPIVNIVCNPMCYCEKNYARNSYNICIPIEDCPKPPITCRPDEVYNECANGGCGRWECSQQGPICVDLIEGGCIPGCRCAEPLLRADDGTCVPADQCPPICSGQNEVIGCRTFSFEPYESFLPTLCIPECLCIPGFYRNKNGDCIPKEQCSNNCGPNEIFDICPPTCPPPRCDFDEKVSLCLPNLKPGDKGCKPGCRCIDNYKKNKFGVCIPKEECPPIPSVICGPDEVYNECANGGCGRWECSQENPLCVEMVKEDCVPGCRCAEPLLRADDGSCVPADQCPLICYGQNEVVRCRTLCPETCESIGKNCTIFEPLVCINECRCKPGYYRNKTGNCIPKEQCYKEENGIKKFTEGNVVFTENFLRVASKINTGVSAIYSPFSLLFLLAQLAIYTTGTSKQQLLNVLNLKSDSLIRSTIPPYLDDFNSQKNVSLDLAERVYGNIQYQFSKKFLTDTKNIFKAEAQNLDFSKASQAAKTINDWIALKTHDLIKDLVSPDTLSIDTRLVLVNAIYFKGNWRYPFKTENTKQQDFYVNKHKTVKVNMMKQTGSFNYAEINKPNIQVLELPYVNNNLTYLVCLPKTKDGIDELIDALGDPSFSALTNAISNLKSRRVDVSIPSMETTTTTDLGNVLRQLNVTAIFDPKTAGFSGILQKPEQLFVSSATQKAKIIVTETGTEAAAANVIVVGVTSAQLPVQVTKFVADHTFAYFILYKGTPIFCGIYRGPQ